MKIRSNFLIKLNKMGLENACRICITGKSYLRDINQTRISKMIEACSLIKISEKDGLPQSICAPCFRLISKFYIFKKKIERNDKILRHIVETKHSEKEDFINIALENVDIGQVIGYDTENFAEEKCKSYISCDGNLKEQKSDDCNIQEKEMLQVYGVELPPLIRIEPDEKFDAINDPSINLPLDTPPLVPLKPHIDINTLVDVMPELECRCYICHKKFGDISALKTHTLTACKPKDLQCNVCLKEFVERKKLIGHLKGHMIVKHHTCKICSKKYPNPSTFRVHMRSHTGEKPFKCQICNKGFVRWAGVRLHMKTHEDVRPFSCDMCPKAFKISSNLERHKRIHYGIEPYNCSYCQKPYSQLENLTMHIRTYHTYERPFLCSICGKGFVNSTRLNRHMRIHSGCKPYKCRLCPKTYSNNTDLRNHELYHLGKNVNELKNYSCSECDMKFFHPCRLAKHRKVHQKNKCEMCNKVFKNEESYKTHLDDEHGLDEFVGESYDSPLEEVVAKTKDVFSAE